MHHAAWVIAPLVLVGVLGLSAATKAGKGESLRSIIANLRLPAWVLPASLARAIPAIELALAVGLLAPWVPLFAVAAVATLLLRLLYCGLIARGLTISPRPACGCFGDVDQPITGRTLLRNSLLVAAAGAAVALAGSGRTVWTLLADAGVADWLWLGLATLACAVSALVLGASGSEAAAMDWDLTADPGPAVVQPGEDEHDYIRVPTPQLLLQDPEAGPVTLLEISAKRAQLLVFVNCYCASTTQVVADLDGWQERLDLVDVRMVFSVPIVGRFDGNVPVRTLVDHQGLAWQSLGLTGSPNALLLGVDGYLAGGPVSGPEEVREFIDAVEATLREVPASVDDVKDTEGQLTGDR